jgi:tRNA (mo5U34)-methyltransferase
MYAYDELAARWPESDWLAALSALARSTLDNHRHGDLPRWLQTLSMLPPVESRAALEQATPHLGNEVADERALREILMGLHPWRKGPLMLGGVTIDTEWRSDWKWDRVSPHVDLRGARILDIGCGNGYFGWRMLDAGARLVIGIDPTLLFVMQWLACRHFAGDTANYVLPLGIEDLPAIEANLDAVFSMGVLYHRKEPDHHLRRLYSLLRPGGALVLETLVLPPDQEHGLLVLEGRYARMRNVWAVPGTGTLLNWVKAAGFSEVRLVDVTMTTVQEQRSTDWMRFESLQQALDSSDQGRTVEGLPAPIRATVVART